MYIPPSNQMTDNDEIIGFMQRFSFATIITAQNQLPIATHLPFVVWQTDNQIYLASHFAKANPQWQQLQNQPVLVVFAEPHAYISPKNYDKLQNVPTWNYLAVHCYGKASIIANEPEVMALMEKTINFYESGYQEQWRNLPDAYKTGLAKGVVAFEILVTDVQAKKKLSQNKTPHEIQTIINTLANSPHTHEQLIAEYMQPLLP